MKKTNFIGIDVSKGTLDICLVRDNSVVDQMKVTNDLPGIKQAFGRLRKLGVKKLNSCCCMEHTGIYNLPLLNYLWSRKYSIWLERALQIKQSMGAVRGKSDKIDAVRIAQYAFKNQLDARYWEPEREEILRLKMLLADRRRLINAKKQLSVPLKEGIGFMDKTSLKFSEKLSRPVITALERSIAQAEKEINRLIQQDSQLKHLNALITSVQGVGPVTAAHVITTTNEFLDYNNPKKYSCYSGIAPFPHTSGSSIRGRYRVSHLANKTMKTLLHLSAMAAIHAKGELQDFYRRKVAEGKNKMSVINAVRNKLILRIFSVVKRNEPYRKNYQYSLA
jgi:transposase